MEVYKKSKRCLQLNKIWVFQRPLNLREFPDAKSFFQFAWALLSLVVHAQTVLCYHPQRQILFLFFFLTIFEISLVKITQETVLL